MSKRDLCVRRFHGGTPLLVVTSYSPEFVSMQRYGVRRLAAALLCSRLAGARRMRRLFFGLVVPAFGLAHPRRAL